MPPMHLTVLAMLALLAMLACVALPAASDIRLPTEAQAATALLPTLLGPPAGEDGDRDLSLLVVAGRARWLSTALHNLSAATAVVSVTLGEPCWDVALAVARWPDAVFLLVADGLDGPDGLWALLGRADLPMFSWVVLWTTAPAVRPSELQQLEQALLHAARMAPWITTSSLLMLVTVDDGATHVLSMRWSPGLPVVIRVGVWAAGYAGQPLAAPRFRWGPPANNGTATVLVVSALVKYSPDLATVLLEALRKNTKVVVREEYGLVRAHETAKACRRDLVIFTSQGVANLARCNEYLAWGMFRATVVVPAGLGAFRPLHGVVSEFSIAMWYATGGAVMAVAAASLTLARFWRRGRRGSSLWDAVRTGLAPLLGQAAPEAAGQRSLLGVWLLACVVLSAAYTGQLLAELSAKQRLDIDSIEELVASGLSIRVSPMMMANAHFLLPASVLQRTEMTDRPLAEEMAAVAERRDSALVVTAEGAAEAGPWLMEPARVHLFECGTPLLSSQFAATPGSPLLGPVRSLLGRARAGGLTTHLKRKAWRKQLRDVRARHPELEGKMIFLGGAWRSWSGADPRVLTLQDLTPAFLLLVTGMALSALALVGELLVAKAKKYIRAKSRFPWS